MLFARSFLIASIVGGALAQISGVSSQCQSTIIAVAASPQSECLNPNGLLQVFLQGTSSSIVTPVDTWLKGLCARGPCSNDDIAAIVTNVTSGCATDLESILGNAQPGAITPIVQEIYPTVRKAVCLADNSNNKELCVTEILSSVQTSTGTLTIDKVLQILSEINNGQTSSLNGVNLCTACTKQMYNVANGDFPAIFGQGTTIASDVQATCGSSFTDGASDPNIVETASSSTTSSDSSTNAGIGQTTGQQALLSTFLLSFLALAI